MVLAVVSEIYSGQYALTDCPDNKIGIHTVFLKNISSCFFGSLQCICLTDR